MPGEKSCVSAILILLKGHTSVGVKLQGVTLLLGVTKGTPHKGKEMTILFDKITFMNCVWMFVKTKGKGIVYLSRHCSIIYCPILIKH